MPSQHYRSVQGQPRPSGVVTRSALRNSKLRTEQSEGDEDHKHLRPTSPMSAQAEAAAFPLPAINDSSPDVKDLHQERWYSSSGEEEDPALLAQKKQSQLSSQLQEKCSSATLLGKSELPGGQSSQGGLFEAKQYGLPPPCSQGPVGYKISDLNIYNNANIQEIVNQAVKLTLESLHLDRVNVKSNIPLNNGNVNETEIPSSNVTNIDHVEVVRSSSTNMLNSPQAMAKKCLPVFNDSGDLHPVDFITKLEKVIIAHNMPFEFLAVWCHELFEGRARYWADALLYSFPNFAALKSSFLSHFWSPTKQAKVKLQLEIGKYDRRDGMGYVDYFLKQVASSRYLEPGYSDSELIATVSRHFPPTISCALLGTQTVKDALDRLRLAEHYEANFLDSTELHNRAGNRPPNVTRFPNNTGNSYQANNRTAPKVKPVNFMAQPELFEAESDFPSSEN